MTTCFDVYAECVRAKDENDMIESLSAKDKEFHFQNWVEKRLLQLDLEYTIAGRNSYPDFQLVHHMEGYEIKGLQDPGRWASYDSNSQVPTGGHNGREVFYVFGRYPKDLKPYPDLGGGRKQYPLSDLVICHGDFMNAASDYVHKNKSFRGFGTYGDILIRDRKMYVAPTPFAMVEGTVGQCTLIVPEHLQSKADERFREVGRLTRQENPENVVGYSFDLRTNELNVQTIKNPNAGKKHEFVAYRLTSQPDATVQMVAKLPDLPLDDPGEETPDSK